MTGRAPRILAVDDRPENIRLLEAVLVPAGYEVITASSGTEALAKAKDENVDLVLTDIVMPGMSGYELCRSLRRDAATAFLPIVTLTASGGEEKKEALDAGADDFVAKPFDKTELLARVRSLVRVKQYHDQMRAALDRQSAIGEVLKVTNRSAFDLQPVLDSVVTHAMRLCDAQTGSIWRRDGDRFRIAASATDDPEFFDFWSTRPISPGKGTVIGRAAIEGRTVQIPDVLADPEYAAGAEAARWGFRTNLAVPLVRDGDVIGMITLGRARVAPFAADEVALVETFADHAVIAIANVELFEMVERQRQELSRFLTPQIAALITSEQGAKMLEGHRRQITVVFTDLRGFTAFAETAEPEEVLGLLREYQKAMGELIVAHRGTLEHFAGDGMMVWFNDPLPVERHELEAVRMACAMRERFRELARGWQKKGYSLGFGVGIATGYATLGRIGFEGRYDYGAVGNVVMFGARLCAVAKDGQVLINQRVQAAIEGDAETAPAGEFNLKGFTKPVPAFDVVSVKTPAAAGTTS